VVTRDIPFDEEVAERDPEVQESFADVRPLSEMEARVARWRDRFGMNCTCPDVCVFHSRAA